MLIGSKAPNPFLPKFNFGEAFARTALIAAGPAFELQFHNTQDALLQRLNEEITEINNSANTKGATALLDLQISRLNQDLVSINDYKSRMDFRSSRVVDTLTILSELKALADPSTVADFDAKLAATIDMMEKTPTPIFERYGVPDRLRAAKLDGLAQLQALAHNNFATQTDIDTVTAAITAIEADYTASKTIIDSNVKIAFNLKNNAATTVAELTRQASNIKTESINAATDRVQEKQELYGQVLTAISLSFEASRAFSEFIANQVVLPQEAPPGSVLNLFS